jgi:hypothetical protein
MLTVYFPPVNSDGVLDLLNEPTEIEDKPDAAELLVAHGDIEFGKVSPASFKLPRNQEIHVELSIRQCHVLV